MVSFISLFLGLVFGYQTVALEVADPVNHVEILLDGQVVLTLARDPWRGQIDLGPDLQPHELTAVAFDPSGVELDRATQWLNLPRQPAETTILLERDRDGEPSIARVSWESLTGEEPSATRVEFDGRQLDFDDPRAITLPAYDPERLHFLRIELEFAGFVRSSAEITFGGTYSDQVNSDLTALALTSTRNRKRFPTMRDLRDGFLARDKILQVAAVEKGQVELLIVRDQGAWSELRRIRSQALTTPQTSIPPRGTLGAVERNTWFRSDRTGWNAWTLQFLWSVPRRLDSGSGPYDLFSHSARYPTTSGSLHGWLATVEQPAEWSGDQRLADAVAIAGVTAAGSNRRRAVLLVLGAGHLDDSTASPMAVRRYLQSLAVPLFVWTVSPEFADDSPWGPVKDASSPNLMSRASNEIFHLLEQQRIVWIEGLHLPQEVEISAALAGRIETSGFQGLPSAGAPAAPSGVSEVDSPTQSPPAASPTTAAEVTVLGKPSAIQATDLGEETVVLGSGARIREQPRADSPVLEILPNETELPVLDRHDAWLKVQFGSWLGWVHPDGEGPDILGRLAYSSGPDDERLLRARSLLDTGSEPSTLGPFTLYTDVKDVEILDWLDRIAWDIFRAYRERFDLDPGEQVQEAVVLFADEDDYRRYESAEDRIARTDSRGTTSEGLSVLYTGDADPTNLASVFIHELAHLLNRKVFQMTLPPWLEEGMAEDLAFSRVTPEGLIRLGTLAGVPRQGLTDRQPASEPRAHLKNLVHNWSTPSRPPLDTLINMDWVDFIRPADRAIHYATSAMLVRYLLETEDRDMSQGFRRYLNELASSELAESVSLWNSLGTDAGTLEEELFQYVSNRARAYGIR